MGCRPYLFLMVHRVSKPTVRGQHKGTESLPQVIETRSSGACHHWIPRSRQEASGVGFIADIGTDVLCADPAPDPFLSFPFLDGGHILPLIENLPKAEHHESETPILNESALLSLAPGFCWFRHGGLLQLTGCLPKGFRCHNRGCTGVAPVTDRGIQAIASLFVRIAIT